MSQSLVFARPEWVYYVLPGGLLALALAAVLSARLRRRSRDAFAGALFGRIELRSSLLRRSLKLAMAALAWALLCVGLGRPQKGAETVSLPRGGADILVLVDVSNSMLVGDMVEGTSRLEWARRKISDLLDELERDPIHRVGLMPFAGEPFLLVPPTPDYDALRFFLEDLNPRSVGFGGSDLARALDRAADELAALPGRAKAVLVVSDGDAVEPGGSSELARARELARTKAVEAARDANRRGVAVFALGVGGSVAREVTIPDGRGGSTYVRYKDPSGSEAVATSALDETTLALVGSAPGAYVHTTLDGSDIELLLRSGLASGGAVEDGEHGEERSIPVERMRLPLLGAFVLFLAELFVPSGRKDLGP